MFVINQHGLKRFTCQIQVKFRFKKDQTGYPSTANNFLSLNTARWDFIYHITTLKKKHQHLNITNPYVPLCLVSLINKLLQKNRCSFLLLVILPSHTNILHQLKKQSYLQSAIHTDSPIYSMSAECLLTSKTNKKVLSLLSQTICQLV